MKKLKICLSEGNIICICVIKKIMQENLFLYSLMNLTGTDVPKIYYVNQAQKMIFFIEEIQNLLK